MRFKVKGLVEVKKTYEMLKQEMEERRKKEDALCKN